MKNKFRILSAIILTVLMSLSFASALSTSDFSIDYVSSDIVDYGDVLTVMGSGVTAGSTVNVYWDFVTAANLLNVTTGLPNGDFECTVKVPSAVYGDHYLWAKALETGITVSWGPFVVNPYIELSRRFGTPGTVISISGYGFAIEESVILTLGGIHIGNFTTDNLGEFSGEFTVPAIAFEAHKLRAEQPAHGISVERYFRVGIMVVLTHPTSGMPGTEVMLTGIGFTENGKWNAIIGDMPIFTNEVVSSDGQIEGIFFVPNIYPGTYTLTVIDSL